VLLGELEELELLEPVLLEELELPGGLVLLEELVLAGGGGGGGALFGGDGTLVHWARLAELSEHEQTETVLLLKVTAANA